MRPGEPYRTFQFLAHTPFGERAAITAAENEDDPIRSGQINVVLDLIDAYAG